MDEVTMDGVVYTKAAVAAKQCNYTADYIGQLCRGKKIDARLVGRTWYVNLDSIAAHKQSKTAPQKEAPAASERVNAEDIGAVAIKRRVEPVLVTKTARNVQLPSEAPRSTLKVQYSIDEGHLIPEIRTNTKPASYVPVTMADGKSVQIGSREAVASFRPADLPSVALSGSVAVEDLQGDTLYTESVEASADTAEQAHKKEAEVDDIVSKNKAISVKGQSHKSTRTSHAAKNDPVHPVAVNRHHHGTSKTRSRQGSSHTLTSTKPQAKRLITIKRPVATRATSSTRRPVISESALEHRPISSNHQLKRNNRKPSPGSLQTKSVSPEPLSVTHPAPGQTAAPTRVSASTASGALVRFVALLLVVIGAGLYVGYALVVSTSEYSVTTTFNQ